MKYLDRESLSALFRALAERGFTLVGPVMGDGAIVYDELGSPDDLPAGWTDEQDGGTYRLRRRGDEALFGYVVGPHSWKRFLLAPVQRLWTAARQDDTGALRIVEESGESTKYAFIGVRSCELHAVAIQDRVLKDGAYADAHYRSLRERVFTVAVNCGQAGGTCFCVSMETGPEASDGFDLALTELLEGGGGHGFVVETGSERGAEVLSAVRHRDARPEEQRAAARAVGRAAASMGREVATGDLKELLYAGYDHPSWDEVARRCLACGNCTQVCPTCFCTTVEDVTALGGHQAERVRRWDSCFTTEHAYIHGGSLRGSVRSRYRQWLTHKLATWVDQFGTSGCVGCGRCITWCPVGIDITEEVRAIRERRESDATVSDSPA
jgi:ferredoxin